MKLLKSSLIICALLFSAQSVLAQQAAQLMPAKQPASQVMLVVSAAKGSVYRQGGDYLLLMHLDGIQQILSFTERPYRLVKYVKRSGLKQAWFGKAILNNFNSNPPNAVLATIRHRPIVVTVTGMYMHSHQVAFMFHAMKPGMFTVPTGQLQKVELTIDGLSGLAGAASKAGIGINEFDSFGQYFKAVTQTVAKGGVTAEQLKGLRTAYNEANNATDKASGVPTEGSGAEGDTFKATDTIAKAGDKIGSTAAKKSVSFSNRVSEETFNASTTSDQVSNAALDAANTDAFVNSLGGSKVVGKGSKVFDEATEAETQAADAQDIMSALRRAAKNGGADSQQAGAEASESASRASEDDDGLYDYLTSSGGRSSTPASEAAQEVPQQDAAVNAEATKIDDGLDDVGSAGGDAAEVLQQSTSKIAGAGAEGASEIVESAL